MYAAAHANSAWYRPFCHPWRDRLREQRVKEDEIEAVVTRMLRFVDLEDAIGKMPMVIELKDRKGNLLRSIERY